MKKQLNLIRLGSLCQKKYNMSPENMKIMRIDGFGFDEVALVDEKVKLEKFYFLDGEEYALVGYSIKHNILFLKGIE